MLFSLRLRIAVRYLHVPHGFQTQITRHVLPLLREFLISLALQYYNMRKVAQFHVLAPDELA